MRARLRRAFNYSNIVSTLALFAALGGITYAATLPRNSVGTSQVRSNAITLPKLAFSLGLADGFNPSTIFQSAACPPGASCPPPLPHSLTSVRARLKPANKVLLLGSATFSREGSGGDRTFVSLGTAVADTSSTATSGELDGSDPVTLSFRKVVSVAATRRRGARHRLGLEATAVTQGNSGVTVKIEDAELIAIVLPAAR